MQIRPEFAETYNNLGTAWQSQGKLPEAVACYRRALELKPDFAEAHNNLSAALKDQGQLDEALDCCRRALQLRPDYAEAHSNLGLVLKMQEKMAEAIACYRQAVELRPDFAEAHNNLANALTTEGKLDEALGCCRRALQLKPGYAAAHINLGVVWKSLGKLDQAVACFRRALQLKPDDPEAHLGLATLLLLTVTSKTAGLNMNGAGDARTIPPAACHNRSGGASRWPGGSACCTPSRGWAIRSNSCGSPPLSSGRERRMIVECNAPWSDCRRSRHRSAPLRRGRPAALRRARPLLQRCRDTGDFHRDDSVGVTTSSPRRHGWRGGGGSWPARRVPIGINWRRTARAGAVGAAQIPLEQFAAFAAVPAVQLVGLRKRAGALRRGVVPRRRCRCGSRDPSWTTTPPSWIRQPSCGLDLGGPTSDTAVTAWPERWARRCGRFSAGAGLALAAGSRRLSLVSQHASLPAGQAGRLGRVFREITAALHQRVGAAAPRTGGGS